MGFDRYECEILFDQIIKYKDGIEPFDLDTTLAKDNPLNWWKYIEMESEPAVLRKLAFHLLAFVLIQHLVNGIFQL